jgi:general secretion pathway protein G
MTNILISQFMRRLRESTAAYNFSFYPKEGKVRIKSKEGFTLIEVIVVAGIIAVLAGILVPIIFKEIDESKKTRALADAKSISTAILVLKKDTGSWPVSAGCVPSVTILNGSGPIPAFAANWDQSSFNSFSNYLGTDDNGCWSPPAVDPATWKGPYMASVNADPWGHAYLTNASEFLTDGAAVWILSAGPDGIVDTGRGANALSGDDIGLRIK